MEISDLPIVSIPAAGPQFSPILNNHLITVIHQTAHDDLRLSTSISALAINDLAPVSISINVIVHLAHRYY